MVNFNEIAKKWQKKWEEKQIFKVKEDPKKRKFYRKIFIKKELNI